MSEQAIVLSGREAITERIGKMVATIYEIDNLTSRVAGVRDELRSLLDEANVLGEQALAQDAALVEYQQHEQHLIASFNEMQNQRDAVLDEMSTLLTRLTEGDFFSGQTGGIESKVYSAAMEYHNEAFWQSLPYDVAETLGKPWQFQHADLLISLLIEDEEMIAEGRDLEVEDVIAFRSVLFDIVKKLYDKHYEDGE